MHIRDQSKWCDAIRLHGKDHGWWLLRTMGGIECVESCPGQGTVNRE